MKLHRALGSHLSLAALAFAGLVAGHWISYLVVAPDPHARQELLAATGHGSHHLFLTLGLAAAVAAMIATIGGHLRNRSEARGGRQGVAHSALSLWLMQTTGFVALEAFERVHGWHELETLLQEPAFILGLAAQALVAVAAALVVWVLRTTVDAILRLLALPRSTTGSAPAPLRSGPVFHSSVARAAWNLRGPPVAACIQG